MRALPLACLALALAGCSATPVGKAPRGAPEGAISAKVLDDLSLLAVGAPLPDARRAELGRALREGRRTLDDVIGELLDDPRFARVVAPEIVFNKKAVDLSEEDAWATLEATSSTPPVYYLRDPCDAKDAERVHPWWAMDTEVLVCRDSYQPTHLREPKTGWYCSGENLDPSRSDYCGCGPNLMSCARDEAHYQEIRGALRDELVDTVAWVVGHDLPLSRLFTMNETVRGAASELFYQRWQVVNGERSGVDVRAFVGDGKPAPRLEENPGQHAGLLTAPHLLLYGDTPRARMRNAFSDLWCVAPSSVNVSADQVLALGDTDLRDGEGWRKLAVMPICTDCHARLDHGMQFFAGYPSSFVGVLYDARAPREGHGILYGFGSGDLRGEGPRSPRSFAELAVAQPEFGRCMARDVADHVWNGGATQADRLALAEVFAKGGTMRALMRAALHRYAERAAPAPEPPAPPPLAAQLEAHCQPCHRAGEHAFPQGAHPPELLQRMLRQVAFGDMPRAPATLADDERAALVRALIDARWDDEASRREAQRYFAGGMRGLPVHRGSAILGLVEARAGGHDEEASSFTFSDADRHDTTEARPSFVLTFALAAQRTCRAAGHTGRALAACVKRALDVEAATKTP